MADGRFAYRLKTPWRDGTTHVVMERRELLERLAPLIPPPRAHQVRDHGVLAPCARARDRVVPDGSDEAREEPTASKSSGAERVSAGSANGAARDEAAAARIAPGLRAGPGDSSGRRTAWSDLLKRVFEVDALHCSAGGGPTRLVSTITDPSVAARFLECRALPPRAPPLATAKEIELASGMSNRALDSALIPAREDPGFEFAQTSKDDRLSNEGR